MILLKREGDYLSSGWRQLVLAGVVSVLGHWALFEYLAVQDGAGQPHLVNSAHHLTVNLLDGRPLVTKEEGKKELVLTSERRASLESALVKSSVNEGVLHSLTHWPEPYLPSSLVDVRPHPKEGIVIPFPSIPLGIPKAGLILVLYIGQDGRVDKVDIESSQVSQAFEEAALSAFSLAEFEPAYRGGRAVRSKLRIEAEFMEP